MISVEGKQKTVRRSSCCANETASSPHWMGKGNRHSTVFSNTCGSEKRLQRTKEVCEREQNTDKSNLDFSSPSDPFFLHLGPVLPSFHLLLPTALLHGLQLAVPASMRY